MNAVKILTAILMAFVAAMAVGVPIAIGGDAKTGVEVGYGDIEVESVCVNPNTVTLYPCSATTPITVSVIVYHPNGKGSIVRIVSNIASGGVDFSGFTGIAMTKQGGASICRATCTATVDLPCDLSPGDWTVEVKVEDKEKYKCDTTSFSIAPPLATNVSDALKGREYEHIITVFNTLDGNADFELNATGPGSEWITFYRVEDPETPISSVHIKGLYLFRWDNVPGCDSERLLRFLRDEFYIGWSVNAELQKADDCISIVKNDNSAEIKLDEQNGNAILTINDGRTLDLSARDKNGMLTLYRWHSEQQILVKINVPADAPSMVYKPTINIKGIPSETAVSGEVSEAPAVLQMSTNATILVTDIAILNGTVKSITAADTEIGYQLKIKIGFLNGGNIIATPMISGNITKGRMLVNNTLVNNTLIDSFVYNKTGITPHKIDTITVLLNTTGKETGGYSASVNVLLGDEALAKAVLHFMVLVPGTLTRAGVLKWTYIKGEPRVNHPVNVIACFQNTGEIDIKAKYKGELYRNGGFVDVIESDEKLIEINETYELVSYYNITTPGEYQIKGAVIYEGKEIETRVLSFTVPEPKEGDLLRSLSVEGTLQVGRTINVTAEFENIGTIDTTAMFIGEVYCDDEFIDIVESREKLVTVGETANLVSYYKITMHGDYLISGMVLYDGRETEARDVSFTVPEP